MLERFRSSVLALFSSVGVIQSDPDGSHAECLALQERLLAKVTYVERRIRVLRKRLRELKSRLGNPEPSQRLSKQEAAAVKQAIANCNSRIEGYWYMHGLLREIGDCIAFTYIDKYNIKPMAFKEPPGFLSGKKGTRFERKALRLAFAHGGVAILNDLTNCLRHGDLTVPLGGMPVILELKSGKSGSSDRAYRQKERLEKLGRYLATDRVIDWYHPGEMQRRAYHAAEINHAGELNELIAEALESGRSHKRVEEGLHYLVEAPRPGTEPSYDTLGEMVSGFSGRPYVVFVNNLKQNNQGYYPFGLSIRNPYHIYEFYCGNFVIIIFLDTGYIVEYLSNHGLSIEFSDDERWAVRIRNATPKPTELSELRASVHFWGRLFAEFVSLRWLLDELVNHMRTPLLENASEDVLT